MYGAKMAKVKTNVKKRPINFCVISLDMIDVEEDT
jgi:hypothetical protein